MKRQKMQLMTILGLFLVLVLATFWMKQLQKKEESAGQKSVLSLDKGKVVSFTLSNQSGTLDLKKSGKIWVLEKKKDKQTNKPDQGGSGEGAEDSGTVFRFEVQKGDSRCEEPGAIRTVQTGDDDPPEDAGSRDPNSGNRQLFQ